MSWMKPGGVETFDLVFELCTRPAFAFGLHLALRLFRSSSLAVSYTRHAEWVESSGMNIMVSRVSSYAAARNYSTSHTRRPEGAFASFFESVALCLKVAAGVPLSSGDMTER